MIVTIVFAVGVAAAAATIPDGPPVAVATPPALDLPAPVEPVQPPPADEPGAARRLASDTLHDFKNFFSWTNAEWLGIGGLAALGAHAGDDSAQRAAAEAGYPILWGGEVYGSQLFQVPVAVAWWAIGNLAGRDRDAQAGRDLLRAQLSTYIWTNAIKWPTDRTRPNGEPRSFPSGHATASFATAAVLEEYYGWKVGIPAYAAAAYTAASRVTSNHHWVSDVTFGAALGIVSGRTVTLHLRQQRVAVVPQVGPDRIAVQFIRLR